MFFCVALCCVVLCCVVLYYTVFSGAVLCCDVVILLNARVDVD